MSFPPLTGPAKVGQMVLVTVFTLMFLVLTAAPLGLVIQSTDEFFSTPEQRKLLAISFASTVIFATLAYLMWQGFGWARWVTALVLFVAGFYLPTCLEEFKGLAQTAVLGMIPFCIAMAAVMAFVSPIDEFIRCQERVRRLNR